jgi:hypothetical protein
MVVSPARARFGIEVKGLYTRNVWLVDRKEPQPSLYYVLAFVPEGERNRYFVLSQEEMNAEIAADLDVARQRAAAKGKVSADSFTGLTFQV